MTSHEILGFMSAKLSNQLLEDLYADDKQIYKAVLTAVANAKRVRLVFLEKSPRSQRHPEMIGVLARASMEEAAGNVLRAWLLKKQSGLLVDFLNALEIKHENGVVENLPETMDDAKLKSAVETLLTKYPHENVAVYLLAFNGMNAAGWNNLDALLKADTRLQLVG